MMNTLAIISPNDNSYSETFIQAHKKLPYNIKYYYGGWFPEKLEGKGSLFHFSLADKIKIRLQKKISLSEHAFINSLQREKVEALLVEYGPTACECLGAIKLLQLPMLVHFHGFDAAHIPTLEKYGKGYKDVFAYASAVIAVSSKMKADLQRLGCPADKIELIPYGPAELYYTSQPTYNSLQFIAVGRFVEKKAPYHTIEAFKKVHNQFPQTHLIMAGDGPLLASCQELAIKMGLKESVQFPGVCSPGLIRDLMETSIAFVQHSITTKENDSEGTPVAVLEAQAASLPVIATRHAGITDVVADGITGLLCDEHDVDGMADYMLAILRNKDLAATMGRAGRQRILAHFTLQKHLGTLENAVNKALSKTTIKTSC